LQRGFKEDAWDGIADLVALYSTGASNDEIAGTSAQTDDLSAGLIERTQLWLTFTDYFETLFSAVREKSLSNNIDLYTDELLIRYLDTIGK
jgi:5-methylthioribose kinase